MTTFWILIASFLLVSLALIWFPHFRQQRMLKAEEAGVRKGTNLDLFNERLAILEKELQEDLLDQPEFDALKKELEISLLQDMKQGDDESLVNSLKPKSIMWPSVMSVVVIGLCAYMYSTLGAYKNLDQPMTANNPHAGQTTEQIMSQRVQMMEAQVKAEPENSQLLFNLGHAYISANRYDDAIKAFDKTMELVGVHAELLGPKATALYYRSNQKMTPTVQALVDQALSLDPQDPSTLLLVGMDSFFTADYQKAIDAWQLILDSDRADVDRGAIMNAIESAKMRMGSESAMPNDEAHKDVKPNTASTASTVTVEVSISPELQSKVESTDMVFIFARATEGPKVPLAATKISAESLPVTVTLDDSTNMGGNVTLSGANAVEVIAILSKHGSVRAQPGDIQGTLAKVKVGDKGQLVLDTQVQ
ncbi:MULTISPECIES: c-type cytochrome biogenesis protein CcmI [Shewanella]|uniref:C-type cytochrome biogenesis protein CcmI n=1 Tax=Shewanella fidelis TaxID=173509 RepID=A0AAW8NU80_9GAMM|nr:MULTISPECIES: c-type cytochrome biogenesis protein CcmI [Shewanella]MDR8526065.1 c-type cytochrome biogenesis protein CcmI [Shewanella fidelis]MDW4813993.1 c-type cytochrome biogenesis protein CcmI [Shewanella fidelis]MDW4818164.1 c-type cytochrome biogenesis protein CcmI [Shewanella fidelis]MDW4822328.1 c-type cytochrome biogenesis protein CcmI [Shewanella fidelis]MDW4826420.1 c-type cytochrome biogenesis protein CcmI [Shewanella fidelis]